jgi:hypothetical protein
MGNLIHMTQVHNTPTTHWHGLSVVACAGAACGDRDVICITNFKDFYDLGLAARTHNEVRHKVIHSCF